MVKSRRVPGLLRLALRGRNNYEYYRLLRAGRIEVGVGTYGLPPRILHYRYDDTRLTVGAYTSIAGGTTFVLGGNHPVDRVTTYPFRAIRGLSGAGLDGYPISKGDICVGSDVWIGHGVIILGGVTIGHGAVIAAGSVVASDIPPYAIAAGNPARTKRLRVSESQRAALLAVAWWDWPEEKVTSAIDLLSGSDIDQFLGWAEQRIDCT